MEDTEELSETASRAAELERLLGRMGRGDTGALAQLYKLTRAGLYAAALSVMANAHDAEELTHDAYLRIWEAAPRYKARGTPMAWMLTVTRNLCLMELRRRSRRADLSDQEWDAIPAGAEAVTAEDRAVLQDALASLAPDERQIVLLHAVSGLKHREIAGLLALPLGTVLSKYNRAMAKLRAGMKGE